MPNKMLIDASHPEETRVVVLRGNRVEEFDFESANKKQLRGNIYLAKVTRVEPSLQAAFVDYGGNRHGFLAFSEIHPDYYQIPVSDRQALLEEDARAHRDEDLDETRGSQRRSRRNRHGSERAEKRTYNHESVSEPAAPETLTSSGNGESGTDVEAFAAPEVSHAAPDFVSDSIEAPVSDNEPPAAPADATGEAPDVAEVIAADEEGFTVLEALPDETEASGEAADETRGDDANEPEARAAPDSEAQHESPDEAPHGHDGETAEARRPSEDAEEDEEEEHIEHIGGDAMEEMPTRVHRPRRQYKIQEVIKRRQVLLVQVVKEERGNKGAALTTYLSLAGRYSVLMPNTARGGGISRKITDLTDRKRLKAIAQELDVPDGMGIILRTAGAARTKAEVKRDFEYLLRMWETVRELTLRSTAPSLVYEEGSLIKRSIRDLYNKDIDEVIVAGENGYKEAKEFMRLLMPSHAKNVQPYRDDQPIFAKAGAEAQLDAMYSNQVTLKSGGYLVINQTEALVAIDVNSGRSTREHNIEDTALRTNLEAADEVARQLRLRDLAGLIVVDLIDMEESRNNRAVERRIKDALKNDRARIQVGRISHFGLLEMSRQRIRTGVLEGSTVVCPHCAGAGMIRSTSSIALHVLRVLEDALIKNSSHNIAVHARTEVALYILNQKRSHLTELERRFGVAVTVVADDTLTGTTYHALERGEPVVALPGAPARPELVRIDSIALAPEPEEVASEEEELDEPVSPRRHEQDRSRGHRPREHEHGERLEAERGGDAETDRLPGESEADSINRRRRRRRRRGRGDRDGQTIEANAPQPSDEGLAVLAEIGGSVAAVPSFNGDAIEAGDAEGSFAPEAEGTGEPRRRRARRGGRNRRPGQRQEAFPGLGLPESSEGLTEFAEGASSYAAPEGTYSEMQPEHPHEPYTEAHAEPHAEPQLRAVETAAPAMTTAASAPGEAEAAVETAAPVEAQMKAPELPEAEAPTQKRSGWWQRAKATIVGH